MTGITGRENQLFFHEFGDQIDALTRRTDELLDGRLPRIRAIATPNRPAELVEGSHTPASAAQNMLRYTGAQISGGLAEWYATRLNTANLDTADTMIKATVELSEIGRGISAAGMLLRTSELADYIPPVRYEYATWTQTLLRVAGGILASCSATHLDARGQVGDNANYEIIIDDNTTRQKLSVAKADGVSFKATFWVETSWDLLERQCVDLVEFEAAHELLNGQGHGEFEIEERIGEFFKQIPANTDQRTLNHLRRMGMDIYRRALKVRQTRQELATLTDLPNQKALDGFCRLLRARVL